MKFSQRIALTAIGGLLVTGGGVAVAKTVKDNIDLSQACTRLRASLAATGPMVHASDGTHKAVILGDSYTAGVGLAKPSDGWAYKLGETEGWDTTVAGVGGTGFTDPGYCGEHVYASRVEAALAAKPETLIIQGGLNDADASESEIEAAANGLLDMVKGVPRVVVVGPVSAPAIPDVSHVERALSSAASSHGRQYISASGWDLDYLPDELHLTVAGHTKFAGQVVKGLG